MDIETSLTQLGLHEKEAKVYWSCLNLGQTTALTIARNTELKRPTVYTVLESLQHKGLVTAIPKETTTEYVAKDPQRILSDLEQRTHLMRTLLPTLQAVQPKGGRPKITIYEGKEQMRKEYLRIFESPDIYFYGTDMEYFQNEFADVLESAHKMFRERKTRTKELLNNTPADRVYALQQKSAHRKLRLAPSGMQFTEDNAIWGNNLWIASIRKPFFGVNIESEGIAHTYRTLFEIAWRSAIDPKARG